MNKIKVLILFLAICSVANGAIEHNETKNDNETKARKEMDNSNFGKPIYGNKHLKEEQIFHHVKNGGKSVLKYEVEHHDSVVHFRLEKYGVVNAKCNKDEMLLKFTTHEKMISFVKLLNEEKKILTGGCLDLKTLDVIGVASKVVSFKARMESRKIQTIIVKVKDASFEEVFANAKAEAILQPGFAEVYRGHHQQHHRRLSKQRRDLWGWDGDDDNDDGDDCIDGEPDCNVEFGKNFRLSSFRKSYNGRSLKSYGSIDVTCDTCSIAFTPSITFGLEVRFVKLRKVKLTVNGDLRTTVRVSASGSRGGSSRNEKKIATFRAPPIIFSIGAFPVKLQVTVPVNAGYTASFRAAGKITTGISGSVRADAGVEYDNGRFERIGRYSNYWRAVTPTIAANADFEGEAYLEPRISFDVNNVIRGHLDTRIAVRFEGEAKGSYSYGQQSGEGEIDCSVTSSITASVGGELGLNVRGKNIGPRKSLGDLQILDYSKKLWSGTKTFGGSSFDSMDEDEGTFYDEDTDADNTIRVRDSSFLTVDIAEEDRVDHGV